MRNLFVVFLATIAVAGCDYLTDTVTRHYATLEDARRDRLFEKGWLPDVLPPSAQEIETKNNLDLSTSTGSFHFNSSDSAALYAQLDAGAPTESRFADWPSLVRSYEGKGYSAWSYREIKYTWAFFCTPENDSCDYYLW